MFWSFKHLKIRICFGFRVSNFEFLNFRNSESWVKHLKFQCTNCLASKALINRYQILWKRYFSCTYLLFLSSYPVFLAADLTIQSRHWLKPPDSLRGERRFFYFFQSRLSESELNNSTFWVKKNVQYFQSVTKSNCQCIQFSGNVPHWLKSPENRLN